MDIAFYQPDQPQNTGTMLRLAACMNMAAHVIEPCGFPFSIKAFRRSAMDYADLVTVHHHTDWDAFNSARRAQAKRLVLLTTKADKNYTDFTFRKDDTLLVGSESSGVPLDIHENVDARVTIPMQPEARSINVAVSLAMVVGEALRQTQSFPENI